MVHDEAGQAHTDTSTQLNMIVAQPGHTSCGCCACFCLCACGQKHWHTHTRTRTSTHTCTSTQLLCACVLARLSREQQPPGAAPVVLERGSGQVCQAGGRAAPGCAHGRAANCSARTGGAGVTTTAGGSLGGSFVTAAAATVGACA